MSESGKITGKSETEMDKMIDAMVGRIKSYDVFSRRVENLRTRLVGEQPTTTGSGSEEHRNPPSSVTGKLSMLIDFMDRVNETMARELEQIEQFV
jgi:hypothetical protein